MTILEWILQKHDFRFHFSDRRVLKSRFLFEIFNSRYQTQCFFLLGFRYRGSDIMVSDIGFPVDTGVLISRFLISWFLIPGFCWYVVGILLMCC